MEQTCELSIVIPVMNEELNVPILYKELKDVLETTDKAYEIIFVNDGSIDTTGQVLKEIGLKDKTVHAINFRRNFGQTAAMSAGFKSAKGAIVVAMDGDLQNDPRDIPLLLEKVDEGYDLVSGWRKNRKDKAISRKLPSKIANALIGKITGVNLHDYGCSLKAYRKSVLEHVDLYGEMHRFLPALMKKAGAKICEVEVNHRARTLGVTKYGIGRTFRVILDLITIQFQMRFSTRPLHFIGMPGLFSVLLGFLIGGYLTVRKFIYYEEIGNRPLLMLAVLLLILGVQFLSMGLLAEILIRIYHEGSGKEIYIIRSEVKNGNFHDYNG